MNELEFQSGPGFDLNITWFPLPVGHPWGKGGIGQRLRLSEDSVFLFYMFPYLFCVYVCGCVYYAVWCNLEELVFSYHMGLRD